MRLIDVYRWEGTGVRFVCAGCIQVGEPVVERAPIVKSFTLADGSPVIYPAAKDCVTMTVELECTRVQAAGIESLVAGARLLLTGLRFGALTPEVQTRESYPADKAYDCIITGAVQIGERFAGTGLYSVTIPLQISIDAATKAPAEQIVSWVYVAYLQLDGVMDVVANNETYAYDPRAWSHSAASTGIFVRRAPWFTSGESIRFAYSGSSGYPAQLYRDDELISDTFGQLEEVTVPLHAGRNVLTFYHWDPDGVRRPMDLRLTVYRQG